MEKKEIQKNLDDSNTDGSFTKFKLVFESLGNSNQYTEHTIIV